MKRWLAALVCLCLMGTAPGALAQAVRIDPEADQAVPLEEMADGAPENWDEFFRSMEGRICFTLPSVPDVMPEPDLLDDSVRYLGWTDKVQLYAHTEGGAEFMVHIGDLAPAMKKIREDHPGEEEYQYPLNALANLAVFYMDLYDGYFVDGPNGEALLLGDEEFPECRFTYAYPDSPGVEFRGRGIMDGTRAVLIMAEADPDSLRILEDMHVVDEAEAEAFRSRGPSTVAMGDLRVTFPVPPDGETDEDEGFFDAFTPSYSYLTAEYMAFPFWLYIDDTEHPDKELAEMASESAERAVEDGALESWTLEQTEEGVWYFDGLCPLEDEFSGPQERIRGYYTLNALYVIHSVNTPEGQAFLDTIVFSMEE